MVWGRSAASKLPLKLWVCLTSGAASRVSPGSPVQWTYAQTDRALPPKAEVVSSNSPGPPYLGPNYLILLIFHLAAEWWFQYKPQWWRWIETDQVGGVWSLSEADTLPTWRLELRRMLPKSIDERRNSLGSGMHNAASDARPFHSLDPGAKALVGLLLHASRPSWDGIHQAGSRRAAA